MTARGYRLQSQSGDFTANPFTFATRSFSILGTAFCAVIGLRRAV
jgi:hypothetical protein